MSNARGRGFWDNSENLFLDLMIATKVLLFINSLSHASVWLLLLFLLYNKKHFKKWKKDIPMESKH